MKLLRFILISSLLLVAYSCGKGDSEVQRVAKLHTIHAPQESVTFKSGGYAEFEFSVDDADATFNHALSSPNCQISLRLTDNITQSPKEFSLKRVSEGNQMGEYLARVELNGVNSSFKRSVRIAIRLESGETLLSDSFTIKSGDSYFTNLRLLKSDNPTLKEDVSFQFDNATQSLRAHIDYYIPSREFIARFDVDKEVERVEIGEVEQVSGSTTNDFTRELIYTVYANGSKYEHRVTLSIFTNLPVIWVETPGGAKINSKEEWIEESTLRIDGMGLFDNLESVKMAIKGRGNTTWEYPKKPYNIKFEKKQVVLGMNKHKRWCLLANYMDRTNLRNRVAYFLADQTSLAWTPQCQFVELFLNGKHQGLYLICEQVRVDNDRVNIVEMTPQDNSGDAITGGYLLELDFHYDNMWQWYSEHGTPFSIKFPDEEDLTTQQLNWMKGHISEIESVLYGSNFKEPANGYRKYIDAQSFIDYWLVYELSVNHELGNPGSVYLHKDRLGKIIAGPVWDFDWGTFSYNASPNAQWGLFITWAWWYSRLFEDPWFKQLAQERWLELKPRFERAFDFLDSERKYIESSERINFKMWGINTTINGDESLSYGAAVDRMEKILRERIEIVDREIMKF